LPATRSTFTATFERSSSGSWVVALVEEPNVHGYGETLVEARRNIRDAITTLFGPFGADAGGFDLVEDVRLPEAVLAMVARAQSERALANRQREQGRVAVEEAHLARQAAREQDEAARVAQQTANATSSEAIVTNREAARLLTEQCGFSRAEAAGLLGLSAERVQRLLTG